MIDTGVFDQDRYFDIFAEYAKVDRRRHPDSRDRVANRGPEPATLHLLPTLWFRKPGPGDQRIRNPCCAAPEIGRLTSSTKRRWAPISFSLDGHPPLLFTENETNTQALWDLGRLAGRS